MTPSSAMPVASLPGAAPRAPARPRSRAREGRGALIAGRVVVLAGAVVMLLPCSSCSPSPRAA